MKSFLILQSRCRESSNSCPASPAASAVAKDVPDTVFPVWCLSGHTYVFSNSERLYRIMEQDDFMIASPSMDSHMDIFMSDASEDTTDALPSSSRKRKITEPDSPELQESKKANSHFEE
ncbi:hypothetical protein VHEMI04569 [[Torrubiella] hemipterigena]|uniref:Uncharacterized protein n=1 Tax=[Torrubiella] hemipterigena TaxID=1531966 RepID=A0A0A1SVQ1_9HYPO|nr:hypothetical protein VHEMI04569 [[Torrubiella] hemipterigena]